MNILNNRYISLLSRRPEFRLVWLSQVISLTGDWFNTIAVVIIINDYTDGSALAVSGLFLARTLPMFLISPFAGVIADRFDRRLVMVISNLLRVFIVLGFLLVNSEGMVWLVYVLTISQFTISSFFEPAYAAIVPSLVKKDELLTANALGSATWSAMLTLGAAIGGVVASLAGIHAALIVDAATFAIAAFLTSRVTIPFQRESDVIDLAIHAETSRFGELVDGYRYVRRRVDVGMLTLVKALAQVGTIDVMIAIYAEKVFVVGENGATTLGVLFAAHGIGAGLGPLVGDLWGKNSISALLNWISVGFILIIVGWFIFGIGPSLPVVTFGMVLRGMGGSINWTYSSVLIQTKVPDRYLGRVFGLDFALFTLALSGATLLAGFALDTFHLDPRTTVIYVSIGSVIPLAFWVWSLKFQRNPPPAPTQTQDLTEIPIEA